MPGPAISNIPIELPALQAAVQGATQVRQLVITVPVGGVPTTVAMQLMVLANPDGTLVDMNIASQLKDVVNAFQEVKKELMITNKLLTDINNRQDDQDEQWRSDPDFGKAVDVVGT